MRLLRQTPRIAARLGRILSGRRRSTKNYWRILLPWMEEVNITVSPWRRGGLSFRGIALSESRTFTLHSRFALIS